MFAVFFGSQKLQGGFGYCVMNQAVVRSGTVVGTLIRSLNTMAVSFNVCIMYHDEKRQATVMAHATSSRPTKRVQWTATWTRRCGCLRRLSLSYWS